MARATTSTVGLVTPFVREGKPTDFAFAYSLQLPASLDPLHVFPSHRPRHRQRLTPLPPFPTSAFPRRPADCHHRRGGLLPPLHWITILCAYATHVAEHDDDRGDWYEQDQEPGEERAEAGAWLLGLEVSVRRRSDTKVKHADDQSRCRAQRKTVQAWNAQWGRLGREGNLWWLGSKRANWEMVMGQAKLGWFCA